MGLINQYKINRYIKSNGSMLPIQKMENNVDQWHQQYIVDEPFPHIVLDDFFNADILKRVDREFLSPQKQKEWLTFRHPLEWNKNATTNDFMIPFFARHLIYELNSQPFLSFLERLSGVECLLPDPALEGGGLHSVMPGGSLEVHADFNSHPRTHMMRRVNLLLYLNQDWDPEFGGNLELWDAEMKQCVRSVEPIFNRLVIFNSNDISFHGHPEPLACPEGRFRKSIAVYYYSLDRSENYRSTSYQERPNEA